MDFFSNYRPDGDVAYVTHGGFNDLFEWRERYVDSTTSGGEVGTSQSLAVKILQYEKDYSERKFQIVNQDAVTLERLTKSPHIYDVYGYCGFVYIVPFMTNGNLADKLSEWRHGEIEISSRERLQYALDMAWGLRDLHNIDGDGVPSATHGDLKEHQYLFRDDGRLVLGDFNKGRRTMLHLHSCGGIFSNIHIYSLQATF
jgi:serine/threonine protein kinase